MKGFIKNDKFHPIRDSKGVRKSRDQSTKLEGVRLKRNEDRSETRTYKVWSYAKAPPEVKEKILENWRENYSAQDTDFADNEGILYDTNTNFAGYEALENVIPEGWDLEYYHYIQFPKLKVKDEKKLAKYLGVPEKLLSKVQFDFKNERRENTKLQFRDVMGNTIDLDLSFSSKRNEHPDDNFYLVESEDKPTRDEWKILQNASKKWDALMEMSWKHLKEDYEYEFTEESIKDRAEANDYKFTEDGKLD